MNNNTIIFDAPARALIQSVAEGLRTRNILSPKIIHVFEQLFMGDSYPGTIEYFEWCEKYFVQYKDKKSGMVIYKTVDKVTSPDQRFYRINDINEQAFDTARRQCEA